MHNFQSPNLRARPTTIIIEFHAKIESQALIGTHLYISIVFHRHEDLKSMLDSNKDNLKLEAMKRIIGVSYMILMNVNKQIQINKSDHLQGQNKLVSISNDNFVFVINVNTVIFSID